MPTYITLGNYTDQGIRNIKDTTARAKSFIEAADFKFGVKVREIYWTTGEYDVVVIEEAPDEDTATALAFSLSSLGNVRTMTMRGFTDEEMSGILSKMT